MRGAQALGWELGAQYSVIEDGKLRAAPGLDSPVVREKMKSGSKVKLLEFGGGALGEPGARVRVQVSEDGA